MAPAPPVAPTAVTAALAWWVPAAVVVLAAAGVLVALYFALVRYRVVPPNTRWVPAVCRMDEDTCAKVVDSEYGHLFGLPNAVLGLAWYLLAGVAGVAGLTLGAFPLCATLVLVAGVTVLVSVYLAWALVARLRTHCPLCYASHLLNAALLALFVVGCV